MNNHHLIGAEQVQNAAYSMRESVEQFKLAVGWLADAFHQRQRWEEEYLQRLENLQASTTTQAGET